MSSDYNSSFKPFRRQENMTTVLLEGTNQQKILWAVKLQDFLRTEFDKIVNTKVVGMAIKSLKKFKILEINNKLF